MQLPGLCSECGRTTAKDFVFCPWCGTPLIAGVRVAANGAHRRTMQQAGSGQPAAFESKRLKSITQQLDDLEREFTVFALRRDRDYE